MQILLVEDDLSLGRTIVQMLEKAGYDAIHCADGEDGLYYILHNVSDLIILDRMLPGLDGLSIVREARAKKITTPVLMLTALNAIGDRVEGLESGADDYLVKPFDMRELLARVQALVRRPAGLEETRALCLGNMALHTADLRLTGGAGAVALTRKQARLLELFLRNAGLILTREVIFNRIWGPDADVDEGIIDTYIAVLRRRMKTVGADARIITSRGVGYRIQGTDDACTGS